MMNNYYLNIIDNISSDIDIYTQLFSEASISDFCYTIKNTLHDIELKAKEYAILQNKNMEDTKEKTSKYKKGKESRINFLLNLKSKNIRYVNCYDYSKASDTFSNMLDSLSVNIESNLLKHMMDEDQINKGRESFLVMLHDFNNSLEDYTKETKMAVDSCIRILEDSDNIYKTPKYLSTFFKSINKIDNTVRDLKFEDSYLSNIHIYAIKKATSEYIKFSKHWINELTYTYPIEFTR